VDTPQAADTIEEPETPQSAPAEQGTGLTQIMVYVLLGLLALALFGFGFVLGNNRSLRAQLNKK
jgi:flagellar basal body-associated protein FliL